MRDALSALDQAIACCGRELDGKAVRELLGVVEAGGAGRSSGARSERPPASGCWSWRTAWSARATTCATFAARWSAHLRNLLVLKTAGASSGLVEAPQQECERLAGLAENFTEEDLTRLLQLSLDLYADVQRSATPRFHTELGLLKLVHARRLVPLEEAVNSDGE